MVDIFDDSAPDDEPLPGGKLCGWVGGAITGLGVVPWLLLGLGGGAVFALVSAAWKVARSQPQWGGPLAPLAWVGGTAYAVMAIGLTIGGVALQRRREWARRLLLGLASVYRIAWLAVFVWCLVLIGRVVLRYHGQRWPWTVIDITQGLTMAAVGVLALSVYMASIRRALRSPAVIAACAGGSAFAQALRARDAWAAGLLCPQGASMPSGRYAVVSAVTARVQFIGRLVVLVLLAFLWAVWTTRDDGIDWFGVVLISAWGAWMVGGALYEALPEVIGVAWDQEGIVLRRLFGLPVRASWSAASRAELALPLEPRPDGSTPPFAASLSLSRGRPFKVVMKPDTEAGREFLQALVHHTTVREEGIAVERGQSAS